MPQATTARALLRRLYPWLGRAVHQRWTLHRSFYQKEADALLIALSKYQGRMPTDLALRLEGFFGRLHREWFPRTWNDRPTYEEVIADFRWWLNAAERWSEPRPKSTRATTAKGKATKEPLSKQPEKLLAMLRLPPNCTKKRFLTAWRRFLKENHPDLNPGQTAEDKRRFAEAVALWKRR
jgi:hypothetical protein